VQLNNHAVRYFIRRAAKLRTLLKMLFGCAQPYSWKSKLKRLHVFAGIVR